jgi:hypothetical protein
VTPAAPPLPPFGVAEARRVLRGAARRLLAEQLDRDAVDGSAGSNGRLGDHGADESALLVAREPVPVTRGHRHGGGDGGL